MIVDLSKIFPKSCANNGVTHLIIDTLKITKLKIDNTTDPAEYIVILGKVEYRFSSIDWELDGAMEGLAAINLAEKIPPLHRDLHKLMDIEPPPSFCNLIKLCKENLEYYQHKYQVEKLVPKVCN